MKKRLTLTLALLVALMTVLVAPMTQAQDVPLDDLTDLAQYAPVDVSVFVAIRTDEAYLDTLQAVVDQVAADVMAAMPADEAADMPNTDLRELLGDQYAEIRPWLGDSAAVFVPSIDVLLANDNSTPLIPLAVILAITDFDAAVAYFDAEYENEIESGDYLRVDQEEGSVLYEAQFSYLDDTLITQDVVVTGMIEEVLLPGADARRLNAEAAFTGALDALPAEGYNVVAYLNPKSVVEFVRPLIPTMLSQFAPGVDIDADPLLDAFGEMAIGFTLLDEQSLTIDIAMANSSGAALTPIDLEALAYAPADTALLIHDNEVGSHLATALEALYALNDLLIETDVLPLADLGPLDFLGPDDIATFITLSLEGTYRIDLEQTLAWMDGDALVYVRPVTSDLPPGINAETGVVFTTDDPEATAALVAAVADLAMRQFNPATFEDGTLTVPLGAFVSMPELGVLALTSNDEVLVMGTGDTVAQVLDGADAVNSTDNFAVESAFFLDDTTTLWYIDLEPLRAVLTPVLDEMLSGDDAALAQALLGIFDTSSITAAGDEDYITTRLTLTLSD